MKKKCNNEWKYIQEINKGNKEAFRGLMETYEKRIYGFIYGMIKESHIAQDLTQETFIKVYKSLHTYNPSKEFATWIYTIARNVIHDYLRKNGKRKYNEIQGIVHLEAYPAKYEVEELLEIKEDYERVCRIIDELPLKYKDVIILKYFNDLGYKEIAARLGISEKKVESWLYLARKKIVRQYNKYVKSDEVVALWQGVKSIKH